MKKIFLMGFTVLALMTSIAQVRAQQPTKADNVKVFKPIDPKSLTENPISLFADNWFVVSAGDSLNFNEMTISWGAMGNTWNEPTVTVYLRNTRYTYPIVDNGKYFVLNSFDEQYRDKVKFIG